MVILSYRDDPPGRLFIATEDLPTEEAPEGGTPQPGGF